jgi:hypothetical protein
MPYIKRLRNANYCRYKCLYKVYIPRDTNIPAIEQSSVLQQLKVQKNGGGTTQFRSFQINQFGRYLGTGGSAPTNFR